MKKVKLFLISCVALLGSCTEGMKDVEINEKNFPDDNFRALLLESEFGEDSVLTAEEIADIDTIDVSIEEIESLKGIEFFTALTTLSCFENQLTTLDVSKNTALTTLQCSDNKLTALDVSNNTALTYLDCTCNQLTSLDVSKNTTLTELDCSYNQLTSLDLSKNILLEWLDCNHNQLTSLDVSKNTALTYLDCSNNQLTSLDVSQNTTLTELSCHSNQIKGAAMDALVESLPTINKGVMKVIWQFAFDGNEMTTKQVDAAKAKGWTSYNGEPKSNGSEGWYGYGGIDEEGTYHLDLNIETE